VAGRRREQGTISGAKLRPRDLATPNVQLVAQDQQLDVLDIQATATPIQCAKQRPEREVEEAESHIPILPKPARKRRDTSIGALQGLRTMLRFRHLPPANYAPRKRWLANGGL
jgi:hypothetical protein